MLLLLLSHFSHVRLCVTPETAAHQAPPSLGFSRQEHWSGLPFPSPMHEVKSEKEVAQSCPTLGDPMDCSLSGSSLRGIFQARVLEWGAIAFCRDLNIYNSKGRLCLSLWLFTDVECCHSRHIVGLTCLLFQVRFCLVACLAHKT